MLNRVATRRSSDLQTFERAQNLAHIVAVVRDLSLTRSVNEVAEVVRHAARRLVAADGATFVLNDQGFCYYADEDAIGPLWKGHRFPQASCISGWAMINREQVGIEDIYADARIPHDAYRPTFVKSLVMTPIRRESPVGAIGVYWASQRVATAEELELLQALADTTSVAMENIQVYQELEQRVAERTAQLESAMKDLESFSYSVSHDLRAPLRSVRSFSEILQERCAATLDEESRGDLDRIVKAADRMNDLIDDMLNLSRVSLTEVVPETVDLSDIAAEILSELRAQHDDRTVETHIAPNTLAHGDPGLLRILLNNLLGNAWKYSARRENARIDFGITERSAGSITYCVADNGVGFDMRHAKNLFEPFQRLHSVAEFAGSGIGLATAHRVVVKHGGRIWAEAQTNGGARFYFSLPGPSEAKSLRVAS